MKLYFLMLYDFLPGPTKGVLLLLFFFFEKFSLWFADECDIVIFYIGRTLSVLSIQKKKSATLLFDTLAGNETEKKINKQTQQNKIFFIHIPLLFYLVLSCLIN